MTETCETDISTVQLEWGLSRNEACCNDGGGYIEMMGIINKEKSDRIASDLEFDTDFTYSFWVKITNDNSLKQILVLEYSLQEGDEIIDQNFMSVKDQKVVISLLLPRQSSTGSLQNEDDNFECSTPPLSSVNAK